MPGITQNNIFNLNLLTVNIILVWVKTKIGYVKYGNLTRKVFEKGINKIINWT